MTWAIGGMVAVTLLLAGATAAVWFHLVSTWDTWQR